jgi:ribosomal protein S18 acetylase RimI-like enzyme
VTSPFIIRRADPSEAEALARFAEARFRETFGPHFPEEAMDLLCSRAFARPVMAGLLAAGTWVAEGPGGCLGYLALATDPCPLEGLSFPQLELARLYVAPAWQGRGVGDALMTAFQEEARNRGAGSVWLEAHEGNPRALRFYQRWGFRDLGGKVRTVEGVPLPHRILGCPLGLPTTRIFP